MKVGLIARGEDRGLGNLTREWARNMEPDRTLLLLPDHQLTIHAEWYPTATTTLTTMDRHRRFADVGRVKEWLGGLDVVYSAETFYDWRICEWARERGVRTVCHVMPEYWLHGNHELPAPDAWWAPTGWRLGQLPEGTRVVPVPIALDRFGDISHFDNRNISPIRWLVVGDTAAADRNGTMLVLAALGYLRHEHHVTLRLQAERALHPRLGPGTVLEQPGPVTEYWELYADADVLVMPRRYGGLSMTAREAMAAGLALVMTDTEPQHSEWPIVPLRAAKHGIVRTVAGYLPLRNAEPGEIARTMDRLAEERCEVHSAQCAARTYAETQGWEQLRPVITAELERVKCANP